MRRAHTLLGIVALLVLPPTASGETITLDAMIDAFPPSPCLPNSGQLVIFRGGVCDGTSCPPDPVVTTGSGCDNAGQTGLPGVFAPYRFASVWQDPSWAGPMTARIVPGSGRIDVSTSSTTDDSNLQLSYFRPGWDWNLNLSGALEIRFTVAGDISPSQPLVCNPNLYNIVPNYEYAEAYWTVEQPGTVVIPISALATSQGFDLSAVDQIDLWVYNCTTPLDACPGPYPPRQYSIGPISITGDLPTLAARPSWGQLKVRYR